VAAATLTEASDGSGEGATLRVQACCIHRRDQSAKEAAPDLLMALCMYSWRQRMLLLLLEATWLFGLLGGHSGSALAFRRGGAGQSGVQTGVRAGGALLLSRMAVLLPWRDMNVSGPCAIGNTPVAASPQHR